MTQSAPELTLYELLSPDLRYLKYEKLLLYKKFRIYQKVSEKRNFTDLDIPPWGWRLGLNRSFVVFIFFFKFEDGFFPSKLMIVFYFLRRLILTTLIGRLGGRSQKLEVFTSIWVNLV